MSQDWNIASRAHVCASTGNEFADGAEIVSCLRFSEDGYQRDDVDAAAWDNSLRGDSISVWRSVYRAPPPKPEEPIKRETVEGLLRQLIEDEDREEARVIYILAVMLERKRVLVERATHLRDDGMTARVYEHRKTGESFLILDPELKLGDIADVQAEVAERLGLNDEPEEEESEHPTSNIEHRTSKEE